MPVRRSTSAGNLTRPSWTPVLGYGLGPVADLFNRPSECTDNCRFRSSQAGVPTK